MKRLDFLHQSLAILLGAVAVGSMLGSNPAPAASMLKGPVEARVLSVLDGDTFVAEAQVWPGQFVRVNVRIRGVDAPEMRSRCATERYAATRARELLSELLDEEIVAISNIGGAKYYGRVLADVVTAQGEVVSQVLLERGVVRPYRGGKRRSWCE